MKILEKLFALFLISKDFLYLIFIGIGIKFIGFDLSYYLINSAGITTVFIGVVVGFFIGHFVLEYITDKFGNLINEKEKE